MKREKLEEAEAALIALCRELPGMRECVKIAVLKQAKGRYVSGVEIAGNFYSQLKAIGK